MLNAVECLSYDSILVLALKDEAFLVSKQNKTQRAEKSGY
jgi:hypothetical protein